MKRWFIVLALVLLVNTASAVYVNPFLKALSVPQVSAVACRTNLNCFEAAKLFTGTCPRNYVADRQPSCRGGKCLLCKPEQPRLKIVCRYDEDCVNQLSCSATLSAQCSGNKCICSTQPHVECIRDHDCRRALYLSQNYQRMECQRSKCITPKAFTTLAPKYAVPSNVTFLPRY